jgi:hypothetical protein
MTDRPLRLWQTGSMLWRLSAPSRGGVDWRAKPPRWKRSTAPLYPDEAEIPRWLRALPATSSYDWTPNAGPSNSPIRKGAWWPSGIME